MQSTKQPRSRHDGAWKELLHDLLPDALALLFPGLVEQLELDLTVKWHSLDKEFNFPMPVAHGVDTEDGMAGMALMKTGEYRVDLLLEVETLPTPTSPNSELLHIEVQMRPEGPEGPEGPEEGFPKRMFNYANLISTRYKKQPISLAILGDKQPSWRPSTYSAVDRGGFGINFNFRVCKLLDFEYLLELLNLDDRTEKLVNIDNPVKIAVLAHLISSKTTPKDEKRYQHKLFLMSSILYGMMGKTEMGTVNLLYRFTDLVLPLEHSLAKKFWTEMKVKEKNNAARLPYVTSLEQISRDEGIEAGAHDTLEALQMIISNSSLSPDTILERFPKLGRRVVEQLYQTIKAPKTTTTPTLSNNPHSLLTGQSGVLPPHQAANEKDEDVPMLAR